MILSLSRDELFNYVTKQADTYFPDNRTAEGDRRAFDLALERLEYCFMQIKTKGYQDKGQASFYHLHMDQYSQFLYYYANSIWKLDGNKNFADKLILLNRALCGMWCSYKNNLPNIFLFMHAVGSVIGNAFYSDYLVVLQNVTVNTMCDNNGNLSLYIGKGTFLSAGASVIGNSNIGDWCTLGVGSVLRNRPLASGQLAYHDENGALRIKAYDNKKIISSYFYIEDD